VRLFINGYGNIGKRLATAVLQDNEMELIGVAKYTPDDRIHEALDNNLAVYVPQNRLDLFQNKGYEIAGTIDEACKQSDLILDASKEGGGFENKRKFYRPLQKPAIFQGGEDRHGQYSVANMIHNSRVNYEKASGKKYVIQGSCNVSGMGRLMQPLIENYGKQIKRFDVTLIRRWADLEDSKEVKDSIEWDRNPHHQEDVKDFIPTANLFVDALKVPSRMMHVHQMIIRFDGKAPTKDTLIDVFRNEFGVALFGSAKGTADVRNMAIQLGFPHGDTHMVHIHKEVLKVQDDVAKILYSDDQTGMVIPENYLLIQSMFFKRDRNEALKRADKLFQMTRRKKKLEDEFK
jgi:glyceraldehyde-3-phosphate dehydrogenase (NAD(P))